MELEKTFQVPSNGYFGDIKEITMRSMTTKEEKLLYQSNDFSFIQKIIRSCTTSPAFVDFYKLGPADVHYLMFALRELTFGPTYDQEHVCPECNSKQTIQMDITQFEYTLMDPAKAEEELQCTLPVNKDFVKLHLISQGKIDEIERDIKNKVAKGSIKDPAGHQMVVKLANCIDYIRPKDVKEPVEGEEGSLVDCITSEKDKVEYLNKLHLRDLNMIQRTLAKVNYGLDTTIGVNCQNCDALMEVTGAYCPEFFRPSD